MGKRREEPRGANREGMACFTVFSHEFLGPSPTSIGLKGAAAQRKSA